jgi:hypothetical protein
MRTLALIALASLALIATAAPAAASHMGPCTHEYFDGAIYAVQHYKTDGVEVLLLYVTYCATNTGGGNTGPDFTPILP